MAARKKSATPRKAPARVDVATRDRVKREAMKLLATQGLNGTSLRSIVRASGAANTSALHYHFRDRVTLIKAIADELQEWYESRTLPRLEALQSARRYRVRDVLEAVFGPVIEMLESPGLGTNAVRFIARLGWDYGHEGQEISAGFHRRTMAATLGLLRPLFPDADDDDLQFRIIANMNNVYNGLHNRSYLWRSPFGTSRLMQRENAPRLRELLMRYLEGGLRS